MTGRSAGRAFTRWMGSAWGRCRSTWSYRGRAGGRCGVTSRGLVVQTAPVPIDLTSAGPVRTVAELAAAIEARFGPGCALVGKAVTLVDMLAAEFLVVFHETASGYTTLTQAFNAGLRELGARCPCTRWCACSTPPGTPWPPRRSRRRCGCRRIWRRRSGGRRCPRGSSARAGAAWWRASGSGCVTRVRRASCATCCASWTRRGRGAGATAWTSTRRR